jgi:rubrerythrin
MGIAFKGSEIIDIAIQIERNGSEFYAAALAGLPESGAGLRDCFTRLAAMEREHIAVFEELMHSCYEKTGAGADDDPAVCYLKAFARGHAFDVSAVGREALAGLRTPEEVLKKAIVAEKDSIALYTGIKAFIADDACGREKIERVIAEEMNHLAELSDCLEALPAAGE